jgi:hypothetical protein
LPWSFLINESCFGASLNPSVQDDAFSSRDKIALQILASVSNATILYSRN